MGGGGERIDEYKLSAAEGKTVRNDDRRNEGMCLQRALVKVAHTDETRKKLTQNFVLSRDNNSTWLGHVD
jgi:hypothetical protein